MIETPQTTAHILVVDDDFGMRLLMRESLEQAGFIVEEADDGLPAVQSFQEYRPDLILMDVVMPEMDGFTACSEIRRLPGGEQVPILMVTGLDDEESVNRAYQLGATGFITKPITWPLLPHQVRYVLRASEMNVQLQQYRNHLEELVTKRTSELTDSNTQLKEANELKDKFISLVAHDLRSPLSGILGALDYMHTDNENPLYEEHQKLVGDLIDVGKSMVSMIEEVLNISRLKTGKLTPKPKFVQVAAITQKTFDNLSYLAKQKGVELENEIPPETCFFADFALFSEVIQNLTSNAIKFCNRGDKIRIFLPPDRPRTLAVADTGIGMSPEKQAKLFRIEEKTSTPGTAGEQGTGFGLPFCYDIIQAHGGNLSVQSTQGKGSTFFVELGNIKPVAVIVEADPQFAAAIKNLLQKHPIEVVVTSSGSEGLAVLRRLKPHLLICDLDLPEYEGLTFLQSLRQDSKISNSNSIVLNSQRAPQVISDIERLGFEVVLTKPLNEKQFFTALRELLGVN